MNAAATPDKTSGLDKFIGRKIKLRRKMLGLSQQQLAARMGISASLMYMFEAGDIQVGASYLYDFADVLNVPVSFFFDGYRDNVVRPGGPVDGIAMSELTAVARRFNEIENPKIRSSLVRFLDALGQAVQD